METPLTIGQLARRAGVNVETIRFYERKGLLAEPTRKLSGYRQYDSMALRRVRFIRNAKELGFSLKEIDELLGLRVGRGCSCSTVKSRTQDKIADVDRKLEELQRVRSALVALARTCRGRGPTSECPILEKLDDGKTHHAKS